MIKFAFVDDEARSLYDDTPPTLATAGSAAVDLRVMKTVSFPVHQKGFTLAGSGIRLAIPTGLCGLIMPRSSLFTKTGCIIPNSPGLIDSDYRGEVKIPLKCITRRSVTIPAGTRVAQLLITIAYRHQFVEDDLDETERGVGGFGSTGH